MMSTLVRLRGGVSYLLCVGARMRVCVFALRSRVRALTCVCVRVTCRQEKETVFLVCFGVTLNPKP